MTYSEAMLDGFTKVGGKQHKRTYYGGADPSNPASVCVMGAINLSLTGAAYTSDYEMRDRFYDRFERAWGIPPTELNDEGMPWEHLYGMAVAAGL